MKASLLLLSVVLAGLVFHVKHASGAQSAATNSYTQTNLASDLPGMAAFTDANLVNPWGLSRLASGQSGENHWWAADQAKGVTTLYEGTGAVVPLTVTIPPASGSGTGSPTGTVAVGSSFIFVTLDGAISEWLATTGPPSPQFSHKNVPAAAGCANCHTTTATIKVNNFARGASYSGVTLGNNGGVKTLYVSGPSGVAAYDTNFNPVALAAGAFTDPNVPAGFTANGIQSVGTSIYVTFAPPPPASGGYVDAFSTTGKLLLTLQNGSWFDSPWGVVQAPSNFGAFSRAVLVGNTGSGQIAAFNAATGKYLGLLENASGQIIANPGLWGLSFGNGNADSGPTTTLYFNAGIQNYAHGLFGAIAAN